MEIWDGEQIVIRQPKRTSGMTSMQGWKLMSRLRGMESVESYIGHFEMDAMFNGEPVEPLEDIM